MHLCNLSSGLYQCKWTRPHLDLCKKLTTVLLLCNCDFDPLGRLHLLFSSSNDGHADVVDAGADAHGKSVNVCATLCQFTYLPPFHLTHTLATPFFLCAGDRWTFHFVVWLLNHFLFDNSFDLVAPSTLLSRHLLHPWSIGWCVVSITLCMHGQSSTLKLTAECLLLRCNSPSVSASVRFFCLHFSHIIS